MANDSPEPDLRITKRSVKKDIRVEETEIDTGEGMDIDLPDFEKEVEEAMDTAVAETDISASPSASEPETESGGASVSIVDESDDDEPEDDVAEPIDPDGTSGDDLAFEGDARETTVPSNTDLVDDIVAADPVDPNSLGRRIKPGDVVGYPLQRGPTAWAIVFPEEIESSDRASRADDDETIYAAENILLGGPGDDSDYTERYDHDDDGWIVIEGHIESDTAVSDDPIAHDWVIPQIEDDAEAETQTEDESDDEVDEEDEQDEPVELTAEEAAEMWDTSSRNDFNSDCLSKDPSPQLGMGECSKLWSEIEEKGLTEPAESSSEPDDGGSEEQAADASGESGDGPSLSDIGVDIDPERVRGAYLLIEGGTDAAEQAKEQFEQYIESGLLEVADTFNSPKAQDIRSSRDGMPDTPALVLETAEGFDVVG